MIEKKNIYAFNNAEFASNIFITDKCQGHINLAKVKVGGLGGQFEC